MKELLCDCVNPIWKGEKLTRLIDDAKEISKQTFMKNCNVDEEIKREMRKFPNDYEYFKNGKIYFYTWSAIEFFYGELNN